MFVLRLSPLERRYRATPAIKDAALRQRLREFPTLASETTIDVMSQASLSAERFLETSPEMRQSSIEASFLTATTHRAFATFCHNDSMDKLKRANQRQNAAFTHIMKRLVMELRAASGTNRRVFIGA